ARSIEEGERRVRMKLCVAEHMFEYRVRFPACATSTSPALAPPPGFPPPLQSDDEQPHREHQRPGEQHRARTFSQVRSAQVGDEADQRRERDGEPYPREHISHEVSHTPPRCPTPPD